LLISDTPPFIFIAVPKTGSSSVERILQPLADKAGSNRFNKHVLAMKLQDELVTEQWRAAYKFAFVRNPYTWMYSWYRFRQRDSLNQPDSPYRDRYTGDISFDEFIHSFYKNEMMLKQSDFIATHRGELLVDFVGRFENLQQDFALVCSKLDITAEHLPRVKVSKIDDAAEAMSASSRQIINDYFSQDFDMFGYDKILGDL
jgi:chondroitin 4-sulfotransferase 11